MRNNCDNQIYRNHSFSKLRRKNKQEIQNAKFNLENRNQEINDITKYTFVEIFCNLLEKYCNVVIIIVVMKKIYFI